MFPIILLTLFIGIIWGLILFTLVLLNWFKVKCPQCKQLSKVKEIIIFQWKSKTLTGQPCLKCQEVKPQLDVF